MWQGASRAVWRGRVSEVQVGGGQRGVSHHFRFLLWCFTFQGNVVWKVKQGFVREGVTLFEIDRVTDRVLWVWGGAGGGSGPIVCSSQKKGAKSDVPWLPSMEGTVGRSRRQGGPCVCWDTIVHTLTIWRRGYREGAGV